MVVHIITSSVLYVFFLGGAFYPFNAHKLLIFQCGGHDVFFRDNVVGFVADFLAIGYDSNVHLL